MKRYDVLVFLDRTFWMIEVPELGNLGQAATRLSAPREALDLVSVYLDRPDRHTPPPRIRWVRPRHYD